MRLLQEMSLSISRMFATLDNAVFPAGLPLVPSPLPEAHVNRMEEMAVDLEVHMLSISFITPEILGVKADLAQQAACTKPHDLRDG